MGRADVRNFARYRMTLVGQLKLYGPARAVLPARPLAELEAEPMPLRRPYFSRYIAMVRTPERVRVSAQQDQILGHGISRPG